jgi:hypothetical protein
VSKTYTCKGRKPIPHNNHLSEVEEVEKHVTASNETNSDTTSDATAFTINWKLLVCIATVTLFNAVA